MDPDWLDRASSGRSRTIRLPIVRMIGQPPSVVPRVSAAPQASHCPQGRREMRGLACRNEQRGHDPDRLLRIVCTMGEGETTRHRPLPGAHGPPHSTGGTASDPARRPVHDKAGQETEDRGQRQHSHHTQHANRFDPVEPAPVHRAGAAFRERGADQPAQQCVTGTRREGAPPRDRVPRHRASQRGAQHEHDLIGGNDDDPSDGVGDRLPEDQRSDHVAQRREHDCRTRPGCTSRDERRDRVRGVVQAVGERERQRHPNRDHYRSAHRQSLVPAVARPRTPLVGGLTQAVWTGRRGRGAAALRRARHADGPRRSRRATRARGLPSVD